MALSGNDDKGMRVKCQGCEKFGHVVRECPIFKLVPLKVTEVMHGKETKKEEESNKSETETKKEEESNNDERIYDDAYYDYIENYAVIAEAGYQAATKDDDIGSINSDDCNHGTYSYDYTRGCLVCGICGTEMEDG